MQSVYTGLYFRRIIWLRNRTRLTERPSLPFAADVIRAKFPAINHCHETHARLAIQSFILFFVFFFRQTLIERYL